jgi:UDP:flavonoid glycosyltransferase YjiC (YdhE family)
MAVAGEAGYMTIIVYVSGHGYGHAARMSGILQSLLQLRPGWKVVLRTAAPDWIFPRSVDVQRAEIDSGITETPDSLAIDEAATVRALHRFAGREAEVIKRESDFVRHCRANLLVADIPYLAGEVAAATGVRCIAVGNFTWDWIYEHMLEEGSPLVDRMRESYSRMAVALRLPLCQPAGWEMVPEVVDVGLVTRRPATGPRFDPRPTVFLAGRGQISEAAIERAARNDEYHFVTVGDSPSGSPNRTNVRIGPERTFASVLAGCDIVLSKLGYSLVADCIVAGKRIVYPPRSGFREDAILAAETGRHIPALLIPVDEYLSGEWSWALRAVSEMPPVVTELATGGAAECAHRLIRECE